MYQELSHAASVGSSHIFHLSSILENEIHHIIKQFNTKIVQITFLIDMHGLMHYYTVQWHGQYSAEVSRSKPLHPRVGRTKHVESMPIDCHRSYFY